MHNLNTNEHYQIGLTESYTVKFTFCQTDKLIKQVQRLFFKTNFYRNILTLLEQQQQQYQYQYSQYLDATSSSLLQQNIFRFEIAVNQSIAEQQIQAEKNGMCELPDQRNSKTLNTQCMKPQFTGQYQFRCIVQGIKLFNF